MASAWDADNRLSSVTDNRASAVTNHTYDQTSQLTTMQYPNSVTHTFSYDNRDRAISLGVNGPGGVLASYTQTFGFSGHKQSVAEATGRGVNCGYDSVYRLLSETISADSVAANNGALTYSLDAIGNRSSLTSTLTALQSQAATYDADDRISGDTFDANGNTLTSGSVTYSYDFEDRLQTTSTGVANVYDGDGNRVSETVGGVTTRYLIDDVTMRHAQVLEDVVNGVVAAQYTYGLTRISQNRSEIVSYYGYDAGVSVRQLFNGSGLVTDTYAYDAFGNTVAHTGSTVNGFLYRGEQFDAALGMYYLRARWYLPKTGRFLTQDKYEIDRGCGCSAAAPCGCGCASCRTNRESGAPMARSLPMYLYGGSDPVDKIDPSGRIEYALPSILVLPSAAAVAEAAHQAAVVVLIVGITVFAAYEITEAVDCHEEDTTVYGQVYRRNHRGWRAV